MPHRADEQEELRVRPSGGEQGPDAPEVRPRGRVLREDNLQVREGAPRTRTRSCAASLARATVLRDGSLLLAGTIASCRRRFKDSCGKAAESHLAAALKALGRVDEKVAENLPEADFWLTSAATDLCVSEIFSSLQVPSPSHLFAPDEGPLEEEVRHLQGVDRRVGVQARVEVVLREPARGAVRALRRPAHHVDGHDPVAEVRQVQVGGRGRDRAREGDWSCWSRGRRWSATRSSDTRWSGRSSTSTPCTATP